MMRGTVSDDAVASVELTLIGSTGQTATQRVCIDTGFDGELMLPKTVVESLGMLSTGAGQAHLADGTTIDVQEFVAHVQWHGQAMPVLVLESDDVSLMGMALMEDSRLTIDVVPGGDVMIEPLE